MSSGRSGKMQLQRLGHPLGGILDHGSAYRQQHRHLLGRYCRRLRPCLQTVMLAKCRHAGASDCFFAFLSEFLAPRRASVFVDGVSSDPFTVEDMVFQGTHFGPPLWNIFFADVSGPAVSNGAKPVKFADDLNTYKSYPADTALEVLSGLKRGQQAVHQWCRQSGFVRSWEGGVCRRPLRSRAGFSIVGCHF